MQILNFLGLYRHLPTLESGHSRHSNKKIKNCREKNFFEDPFCTLPTTLFKREHLYLGIDAQLSHNLFSFVRYIRKKLRCITIFYRHFSHEIPFIVSPDNHTQCASKKNNHEPLQIWLVFKMYKNRQTNQLSIKIRECKPRLKLCSTGLIVSCVVL